MSADTPLSHPSGCPCCIGSSNTDQPHAAGSPPTVQYASGLHRVADLDLNALLAYRNEQTATGVYSNGTARWNIDAAVGQPGVNTLDQLRNSDAGLGTPVTLQYHFRTALPSYYKEGGYFGPASSFRPLSDDEKKIVVEELAKISAVTGITFVESSSGAGKTLSFAVTELTASGLGYYPGFQPSYAGGTITGVTAAEEAGDVYFRRLGLDNYAKDGLTAAERAGIGTLVRHEIGHALGLSHPFDGPVVLPTSAQNKFYTMMSYSDVTDYYGIADGAYLKAEMNGMGILDLVALQKLYGANPTYNAGDNIYTWAQDTAFRTAVYDAGGIDLIDLSASTMRSQIDLGTVELSSINIRDTEAERLVNTPPGWKSTLVTYRGENNLGIVGTIENVRAGSGADRINGNSVSNEIWGGAGNDSVWGGAGDDRLFLDAGNDRVVAGSGNDYIDGGIGIDVAGLFGSRANHTITRLADGGLKVAGPEGTDTYLGTEFLAFNDGGKVGLWMNADTKLGGGFDETFYLAKNPDVAAAVARGALSSGFAHYLQWGQAEGRAAVDARTDPFYDELGYLARNPDVAAAVEAGGLRSGWEHYSAYGKAEGRIATLLFDKDYYLAKNADVKAAGMDAWAHFMNYGWKEGRDPSAYLDVSAYLDANADLKAAGVNPVAHYATYGQGEGRLLVATSDLGLDWTYSG